MMKKIEFKGQPFLLTEGGSICTAEQYQNGELSFGHLDMEGNVWRLRKIIGTVADIKITGEIENLKPKPGAMEKVIHGIIEGFRERLS